VKKNQFLNFAVHVLIVMRVEINDDDDKHIAEIYFKRLVKHKLQSRGLIILDRRRSVDENPSG